jgi:hypothetical protein
MTAKALFNRWKVIYVYICIDRQKLNCLLDSSVQLSELEMKCANIQV